MNPTWGCGGCTVRWTGLSRAHCSACHRTFTSPGIHAKHRRTSSDGQGVCLTSPALVSLGYRVAAERHGDVWSGPGTYPQYLRRDFP